MSTPTMARSPLPSEPIGETGQTYKTPISRYIPGDFDPKKRPWGWEPVTENVVVLPDKPEIKTGSIIIPDDYQDKAARAAESGILCACGPDAFIWNSDRTRRLEGDKPKPGCRVVFNRYSGIRMVGDDGQTYYVMADSSVKASRPLDTPSTTSASSKKRR